MGLWMVVFFVLTRDSWKIIQVDFHFCYGYLMLFDLLRGDHKRGDESAIYYIVYILYKYDMYIYIVYDIFIFCILYTLSVGPNYRSNK